MFFEIVIFALVCYAIYQYVNYGYYYAVGSATYCKLNNSSHSSQRESNNLCCYGEWLEFLDELKIFNLKNAYSELGDTINGFIKYITLETISEKVYLSYIYWSIIYLISLCIPPFNQSTNKLGKRFKLNNCIRNHKNTNHTNDHYCYHYYK